MGRVAASSCFHKIGCVRVSATGRGGDVWLCGGVRWGAVQCGTVRYGAGKANEMKGVSIALYIQSGRVELNSYVT